MMVDIAYIRYVSSETISTLNSLSPNMADLGTRILIIFLFHRQIESLIPIVFQGPRLTEDEPDSILPYKVTRWLAEQEKSICNCIYKFL